MFRKERGLFVVILITFMRACPPTVGPGFTPRLLPGFNTLRDKEFYYFCRFSDGEHHVYKRGLPALV
jgi:hypothetical protein